MIEIFNSEDRIKSDKTDAPSEASSVAADTTVTATNPHTSTPEKKSKAAEVISQLIKFELPNSHPFAAYAPKPPNTALDIQESSEKIMLLLRQHPITQIKWLLIALVMTLLPILFASISIFGFLPANFQFAGLLGWYLLVTGFVLESFLKWFYNVYIITDERIIDVDFNSLIFKDISAAKIDNIEDTTASTGGFLASIFDFGTITIQTAAEKREFEFANVPHPNRVAKLINELIIEEEAEKIEGRVN